MSLIAAEQINRLKRDFPSIRGNGNTYYLDVILSQTTHQIKIVLPHSFPNGSVIVEFTNPVISPMVRPDGRTVISDDLLTFNGSCWLSDKLKSVINELQQKGVQMRSGMAMNLNANKPGSPYSPSYAMSSPYTPNSHRSTSSTVLTAEESWNHSYANLAIDRRPEAELDQILANAEYRKQLLMSTAGIIHLRSLISSLSTSIQNYKKMSDEFMNIAKENDDLLAQTRDLNQKVEMKENEICQNHKMYEMEELKQDVKNRIQILNTQITELKEQLDNQTIDYSSFMKKFTELSTEMNMLSACLNLCN